MLKTERADFIREELERLFPETPVPLDHKDAYTLLIAVLLSAQCTDERVNQVTPGLFSKADTPQKMVRLGIEKIREIIRPCGLSPTKAKNIFNLSQQLLDNYDGGVPESLEELEALPGVGHKTASVVMAQYFGMPTFPVDTHIHRLAQMWKMTSGKNVKQTEADLKRAFPEESWNKLHLQIIFFGREYCPARSCDGLRCDFCQRMFPNRKRGFKAKKP